MGKDPSFCVCPFCQISFHGDEREDGSDCPECGEWVGAVYCEEEKEHG